GGRDGPADIGDQDPLEGTEHQGQERGGQQGEAHTRGPLGHRADEGRRREAQQHERPGVRHGRQATYVVSWNSRSPSVPPSRPRPDCLVPPMGVKATVGRASLIPTIPVSSRSAYRNARPASWVTT